MNNKAKQLTKYVIIGIFLILTLMPFIQMHFGMFKAGFLEEKRLKTQIPKFNIENLKNGLFMEQFQKYFNDNFGFRETLIKINNIVDYNIFNSTNNDKVVIGKNDYLFYTDYLEGYDKRSLLTDKEISEIVKNIYTFQAELNKKGIKFLFVITPNKSTIYPELMPFTCEKCDHNHTEFLKELNKQNVNHVDLIQSLSSYKNKYSIYYKRDSHWNYIGAFITAKTIINYLSDINIENDVIYKNVENQNGDLDNLLGIPTQKETNTIPEIKNHNHEKLPPIMLYGDSFAENLDYYINEYSTNFTSIRISIPKNSLENYNIKNTKIVIFEIAERSLARLKEYQFGNFENQTRIPFESYQYTDLDMSNTKAISYDIKTNGRKNSAISPTGENPSMSWDIPKPEYADYLQIDFLLPPTESNAEIEATSENNKTIVKTIKFKPEMTRYIINIKSPNKLKVITIKTDGKTGYITRSIKLMHKI
ncbi:MAG: hypothetical protein US89_C0006G0010 [Candidatus Peregrinibacteria bacterium GW2011_GWF2_38_29]|nr:MAG: hypothetical protein US89_C0006G0010 [Candidatus Peregrinibacteria bacterium GW2011_GWF2_38_29]HBB03200.1 hypothetical protein [Candidatus Peregrinibacteria bacterium]